MIAINKKVKTIDIAKRSGVSVTTVSRYFNHPELLSEKTAEKIARAIRETDYRQDPLARAMVTGRSDLVAVIVPNLRQDFVTEMLSQLERYCQKKNLHVLLSICSDHTSEQQEKLIRQLNTYRVRGVILLRQWLPEDIVKRIEAPMVAIGCGVGTVRQINSDYYAMGVQAGQLLRTNGCDAFMYCSDGLWDSKLPEYKQALGFSQTVQPHPYLHIAGKEMQPDQTAEHILAQIAQEFPDKKVGVLCEDMRTIYAIVIGAMRRGIAIPEQLELIGCGNPMLHTELHPFVACMQHDTALMAQLAVKALDDTCICERVIAAHLIPRTATSGGGSEQGGI